jgi:hypothetical protein
VDEPRAMIVVRRAILAATVVMLLALAIQVTAGGFTVHVAGLRLSNHSALRPLFLAIVGTAVLWFRFDRGAIAADLRSLDRVLERAAPWVAGAAAAAALAVGHVWGTHAAGGSDSYCYVGQAEEFAAGRAILVEPLARIVPLPRADLVFAPVGWVPALRGGAVPMCAPGLSLVMSVAWKLGGSGALHLVVPLLGALTVWSTYLVGRRMRDRTSGVMAAALVAVSPIFLYQVVQPMSDVPAAAFWTAALVLVGRRDAIGQIGGGLLASLAILTRPNLAPALMPLVAFVILCPPVDAPPPWRLRALFRFTSALVPGCALLAWLNYLRYGSPFKTGYGDLEGMFSLAHVIPNASRYAQWMLAAHTPLILLALVAPLFLARRGSGGNTGSSFVWMGLSFIIFVVACYLPYTVFEAWWYIRFLLPAIPVALALMSASVVTIAARAPARSVILIVTAATLTTWYVTFATSRHVFLLYRFERRFITAGTYVGRVLPENAVVITIQESGAVRHYGRRPAALWDALAPDALDETVEMFVRAGRKPYFLLEDWEEAGFKQRFAGETYGALDWGPVAEIREEVVVRLYDPNGRGDKPSR